MHSINDRRDAKQKHSFQHALKWAYLMKWGEKAFSALFTFVMASILGPKEYGTVAMAMIYVGFIQMLLDQGIAAALIQRKDLTKDHLNSAFWMIIVLCICLSGISIGVSPWWAQVNNLPELAKVISVLSISIILDGLSIVQIAYIKRQMDFKVLSIRSNISVIIGGIVGLIAAFTGNGVWSLVMQQLSQSVVGLVLLWSLSNWRPGLCFSMPRMKEIFGFSLASFVGKMGTFFNNQADSFLLGIFFGPVAVGLYRFAARVMYLVLDVATNSLQVVALPEFSRYQDQPMELKRSALRILKMSSIITMPALAGLAVISTPLTTVIGPKWALAANPLKILCMMGIVFSLTNFTGPLMTALGKPFRMSLLTWFLAVVNIAALVITATFLKNTSTNSQVIGIALSRFVIGALVSAPIMVGVLMRMTKIDIKDLIITIGPSLIVAGVTYTVVTAISAVDVINHMKPIYYLALLVGIGGLVSIAVTLRMSSEVRIYVMNNMFKISRNRKNA